MYDASFYTSFIFAHSSDQPSAWAAEPPPYALLYEPREPSCEVLTPAAWDKIFMCVVVEVCGLMSV